MTQTEALRLALEALETSMYPQQKQLQAITAIKAALEAKDEPWEKFCDSNCVWTDHHPDCKLAQQEAKDEPHGWKLVPIEPTDEMLKAMDKCSTEGYDERLYAGYAASVYMAAVDVAPSPSQQHAEDLAKLGWQYFECPACGSEGARAFTKQKAKDEPVAWRDAAIRLGEELSSVGPDGYYDMDAKEWLDWAMEQKPRGEHSLPQRTWVGLTDEEIKAFDTWHDNREEEVGWVNPSEIVAYIEAKLKEKNT